MKIVVAPDKFKGSLPATEVAAAIAEGLRAGRPGAEVVTIPVADGGEGTVDAAVAAGFERVPVTAAGPAGDPVRAGYARRGEVAVVELACVCGLARLPGGRPAPLTASSFGAGEVLRAALEAGARRIVLGVGGSAGTDGGAGLLQALGARVLDTGGGPAEVAVLAAGLRRWAAVMAAAVGTDRSRAPGAGAAGGVGFAALAVLGATRRPGIELVLDLAGFEAALDGADLVITGEGSLDAQSLAGKTPVGVARAAARRGVPVVAVAGRSSLTAAELAAAGIASAYPLSNLEPDLERCHAEAAGLLRQVGQMIARERLAEAVTRA
jgi:glycerate kinase